LVDSVDSVDSVVGLLFLINKSTNNEFTNQPITA